MCTKPEYMNLILDVGNSAVKVSVFRQTEELYAAKFKRFEADRLDEIRTRFPSIQSAILSSVREDNVSLLALLSANFATVISLDEQTPVPVRVCYKTPASLGKDRLAAVVGARELFPEENVLVFDCGTALTVEVLEANGNYLGGNISPGLNMRFEALHQFTEKLPKVSMSHRAPKLGEDTQTAIQAGVQQGILNEVEAYIRYYDTIYHSLKVVFTGGDAFFFVNPLKSPIFVVSNLVQIGLNRILQDYVQQNNVSSLDGFDGLSRPSSAGTK